MMPQFVSSTSKLFFSLSFGLLIATVILPAASIVAFAQKTPIALTSAQKTGGHLVKITAPTKGQQVPAGSTILVKGTSNANATTFQNCRVSVIVDGIKPYQNATGIGSGGTNDFSTWSYKIPATYATLKVGQNKITAKLSCKDNPGSATHNSVNVTGVVNNKTSIATPITSNSTSPKHGLTSNLKILSISLNLTNPVSTGRNQTIQTTVRNGSNVTLAGVRVNGTVTNSANIRVANFTGFTNQSGIFSYTWKIDKNYKPGLFTVDLYASANGYQHQITPTNAVFNVSATSDHKTSSGSSSPSPSHHRSHSAHSSSSHNSQSSSSSSSDNNRHTLSIIHIPHIHFPHIPTPKLPFS